MNTPIWPTLMRFALKEYGITPENFWHMTLPELLALKEPIPQALTKSELTKLQELYPDE